MTDPNGNPNPYSVRDGGNRRVSFSDRQDNIHIHPSLVSSFSTTEPNLSAIEKYKIPQKPPPEKTDSLWDDFESLPHNPSLLLRKDSYNASGYNSRPQSSVSRSSNPFALDREREREPFKQRPVSAKPVSMIKSQSVRTNLDKYRIEMIMLRRIRYLIDAKTVNESHLSMISMLENSAIPQDLLMATFGKTYTTLYSIRILMCQVIDEVKARNRRLGIAVTTKSTKHFKKRVIPTTPQSVLDILQTLEKKKEKKQYKFRPIDWETTHSILAEEKQKRAQSARPQGELRLTREEIIAGLVGDMGCK